MRVSAVAHGVLCDCGRDAVCDAAAHEVVAMSPDQALPVAVVWLKR